MALVTVPAALRFNETAHWRLRTLTPTTGPALDGRQQFLTRENRVWEGSYEVRGAWDQIQGQYLGFLDLLQGAANTFLVPVSNFSAVLPPLGGFLFVLDDAGAEFAYDTADVIGMAVLDDANSTVTTAAPVGSTLLRLEGVNGIYLLPGAYFTANNFLYRVAANDEGTVKINPPLREAIVAGAALEVRDPKIRVRLISDEVAAEAHKFARRRGPYSISVMEAFER